MRMNIPAVLAISFALTAGVFGQSPDTLRILFVGNSLTYYYNMPWLVDSLSMSAGRKAFVDMSTYGGYRLEQHRADSATVYKINHGPWDYVVLQEQSEVPIISYWRWNSFNPACWSFDTLIRNNGAKTALFMTWGWKNGGLHEYNGYYSIIFQDYFHEQDSVAAAYEWIASDIGHDTLVPVGLAWRRARTMDSLVDLWQADNNHPTLKGSYLAACVFFAKLFQANPVGLSYTAGLDSADALFLQTVAYETVFDIADTPLKTPSALCLTVYPNPFSVKTNISYAANDTASSIKIYDAAGRLLRSFNLGPRILNHGSAFTWDGTDKTGKKVSSGVYFIECQDGNKTFTQKIVKLR